MRMPAEWEKHRATWISWPHSQDDFHTKFETIPWVYAEIVRLLSLGDFVEILCHDEEIATHAKLCLDMHRVNERMYRIHHVATDRSWLRDSAPTGVYNSSGSLEWVSWKFNAWAKYDNYMLDQNVPHHISTYTGKELISAVRPDSNTPLVLEGGAIETNGKGTLIVTEECLLSDVQCRNQGLSKSGYEYAFKEYLGTEKTIWLIAGCAGDDTHGHIDDVARFTSSNKVLLAFEDDPNEEFHKISIENEKILTASKTNNNEEIIVQRLPMPRVMYFGEERLPASYANFYITNTHVLVPTFNDKNDRVALQIIADNFKEREVVGISAVDLVLGFGTLHCLTQQEPI